VKNIIVFLTDDHGQWALGSSGNRDILTPNLDRLADEGVVMENAFTPTPVCSPARACFMTGLTASQHGVHDYLDDSAFTRDWLAGKPTIAELLQANGYHTGLVGKWHLGNDPEPQHGFDDWFALAGDYPIDATGPARYSRNGDLVTLSGSKADVLTDGAIDFLQRHDPERPFFLYVSHVSTHSEWAGHPERLVSLYRDKTFDDVPQDETFPFGAQNLESRDLIDRKNPREALAQYYAAVTNIDEGVGRVLAALDKLGLRDETLIVYTSDHGLNCGHHGIWGKGNGTLPLNMVEETIRVPLILNHSSTIEGSQRRKEFVDHLDLFQTLLDFAGAGSSGAFDHAGRSYLGLLSGDGEETPWRDAQFCEYGDVRMVRTDRYKLIDRPSPEPAQLFDLTADPRETTDVAAAAEMQPILRSLRAKLAGHYERYGDPRHSGRRPGGPEPTNATAPWSLAAARA